MILNDTKNIGIITIVIGDEFTKFFERYCRERLENYSDRNGYDLLIIRKKIRELPNKKISWQKECIHDIPWVREKNTIAFIDADILIDKKSPPIPTVEKGKIGVVRNGNFSLSKAEVKNRFYNNPTPPTQHNKYELNSGVLIFNPNEKTKQTFEEILEENTKYDQTSLSHILYKKDMWYEIDKGYNKCVYIKNKTIIDTIVNKNYWFHHSILSKEKEKYINLYLKLQGR